MNQLMDRQFLCYNRLTKKWSWELKAVKTLSLMETDNRSGAWSTKLEQLPQDTAFILSRAAFLGSRFELETLSLITQKPLKLLQEWAENAISNRLLEGERHANEHYYSFLQEELRQAGVEARAVEAKDPFGPERLRRLV